MAERIETPILPDPEWGLVSDSRFEEQDGLLEILGSLPIFNTLSPAELMELERIVHRRHFAKGEMVIRAWIPPTGLFVVLTGSVNVVRSDGRGEAMVIGMLGERELLGEFAVIDDSPRSTHIVAAEPSELIGFFRPDLMELIETNPRCGFKILYRMSQIMLSRMTDIVDDLRQLRATLS